jgi:hypothetical protein
VSRRRLLAGVIVVALLAGAYLAGAAARDDREPIRRVVVGASTDDDATVDKWVTAECPDGYSPISGGAVVPHANDTPGVALYWSAPYEDGDAKGWWAAAQDTARKDRRWLLQVQAVCLSGIEDEGGRALPAETFFPAGR